MEQEKRNEPRLDFSIGVFGTEGKLLGRTQNISISGCFLKTDQEIPKNVLLAFGLPNTRERVSTLCEVAWKNYKGVGTKFILNEKNMAVFLEFLRDWGGEIN